MKRESLNEAPQAGERATFVGGSDVSAILGLSPWKTPYDVWLQKTRRAPRTEITEAQQKRFDRGHRLEPVVIDMLLDRLADEGHSVRLLRRNARHVDREYPFMACEIDFELMLDGEHVTGDCKTVHPFAAKHWGDEGTDEIPVHYASQFAYGLGITGRSRCVVGALIGMDDLLVYELLRNDQTIQAIRARVVQFWNECVLADIAPDPVDFDDCYAMYQHSDGGRIEATSEVRDAVFRLAEIRSQIRGLREDEDRLKYRIADFMRPNAWLTAHGHDLASWKEQPDTRFDVRRFAADHPKLYARYARTKPIRVLRLKVNNRWAI